MKARNGAGRRSKRRAKPARPTRTVQVDLGARSDNLVEVLSGLELGQVIARRGAVDSAGER